MSVLDDPQELRVVLLSSSVAGMISRVVCHPLDTVKARLQASDARRFLGIAEVFTSTLRREGLAGLYRGVAASLVGGVPATALYMTSYEASKGLLSALPLFASLPWLAHLTSGMIAEAVSCIIFVPVDVIKERLQVQAKQAGGATSTASDSRFLAGVTPYKNSWDALRSIVKSEGLSGIYKGYGATLLSFGPWSAIYFVVYEKLKNLAIAAKRVDTADPSSPSDLDVTFLESLIASSSASAFAAFLTSPLDLAKLRYQLQRRLDTKMGSWAYRGMLDGLGKIYREEGFAGFWRGSGARVFFLAPSVAVTMASMEMLKQTFR